jgi:hypothetical protein
VSQANRPAFRSQDTYAGPDEVLVHEGATGLTKRELFAAMAMQGLLACGEYIGEEDTFSTTAWDAVGYADALIQRLNERDTSAH